MSSAPTRSLDLFIQVLLIVSLWEKLLFKFTGPVFKILFLQANVSESECLAERDGSFTVYRVASVHVEILVFVPGKVGKLHTLNSLNVLALVLDCTI